MFEPQITELRQYINRVDEQIRMYRKGRNTERLQDNKARALATIEKFKQARMGKIQDEIGKFLF